MYKTLLLICLFLLNGCTVKTAATSYKSPKSTQKSPSNILLTQSSNIYKANGELHATMRPYTVMGKEYYPTVVRIGDKFSGYASWYGPNFHGKLTSNGEVYDMYGMSAAHKTLPMNTVLRVTNNENNKQVLVRINDRGPFVDSRIIDLSYTAAEKLDIHGKGTALVNLEVLGFEPAGSKGINTVSLQRGPKESVLSAFFVQIGAFERIEGALNTKQEYKNFHGYSPIIKDTEYNNKRLFRVWLGGFKSEAEARDFITEGHFKGSFIVRE